MALTPIKLESTTESVTISVASGQSIISELGSTTCYKNGNVVTLSITQSFNSIPANSKNTQIMTGLPRPNSILTIKIFNEDGVIVPLYLTTSGNLAIDTNATKSAGWYSGVLTYIV